MLTEEITRTEIKRIVSDEVRSVIKNELGKELSSSMKRGVGKTEMQDAIKIALNNLYKYMWTKRTHWNNEIK